MSVVTRIHLIIAMLALLLGGALHASQPPLPPRPNISEYQDQEEFVKDILVWEKLRVTLTAPAEKKASSEPSSKNSRPSYAEDWHHVVGPEDLDTALKNAQGYEQPHYTAQHRFNRTTHVSFPLQHLRSEEMAKKAAEGNPDIATSALQTEIEVLPGRIIGQLDQLQLFTVKEHAPDQAFTSNSLTN